jgi:hypothetical protein
LENVAEAQHKEFLELQSFTGSRVNAAVVPPQRCQSWTINAAFTAESDDSETRIPERTFN